MEIKIEAVKIGALIFPVVRDELMLRKSNLSGHISTIEQKIWVARREKDQEMQILLHEIFHGIFNEFGIRKPDEDYEEMVEALATGFTIFLQDLGIKLVIMEDC